MKNKKHLSNMCLKAALAISVFVTALPAFSTELPAGAFTSVGRFEKDGQALPQDYVRQLPSQIYGLLNQGEQKFSETNKGQCIDAIKVNISKINTTKNKVIKEFESGLVRVDVAKCFSNVSAEKVLSTLGSVAFKRVGYSSVTSVNPKSNSEICETSKTKAGQSSYCYKMFLDITNPNYLQLLSVNEWFESSEKFSAPLYLRESLATAKQVGSSVQLHVVTYVRGPNIPGLFESFVVTAVGDTQAETMQKLSAALK